MKLFEGFGYFEKKKKSPKSWCNHHNSPLKTHLPPSFILAYLNVSVWERERERLSWLVQLCQMVGWIKEIERWQIET